MKYGFIGCGNMGGAVARAVRKGARVRRCAAGQPHACKAQALADELGLRLRHE